MTPMKPHIKRFEEYRGIRLVDKDSHDAYGAMLDNLAEHVERLEKRLEEHTHYANGEDRFDTAQTGKPSPD